MSKIKLSLVIFILSLGFFNSNGQLIGKNKLKKYFLTSFEVQGSNDLPNIGTLIESKIYFKHDSLINKAILVMEHKLEPEFIVGILTRNDALDLFQNSKNEQNLDFIKITSSEIEFIKSPWQDLGLKKGFLHFTSIEENPRRFLAYLYLNLTNQSSIRMKGFVEDDIINLQNKK